MTEFLTALRAWVPIQVQAASHICESTTATEREIHTAQGALKVLRAMERAITDPGYEFGILWPLREEDEGEEL
ncbi:MAG: hypothetical protein ABT940_03395 [Alphaproteobacteria bacterium]